MLKFSEIFEFSKEKFRKIPILKEFEWFEWFEWFGPSPIEPFNSVRVQGLAVVDGVAGHAVERRAPQHVRHGGVPLLAPAHDFGLELAGVLHEVPGGLLRVP